MTADQSPSRGVTGSHLPFGGDGQDVPDPAPVPAQSTRGIRWTMSDRGFKQYVPVTLKDGRLAEVYESSSAESPHLWVNIDGTTTHLTLDEAVALRDSLDHGERLRDVLSVAMRFHYQVEEHDPAEWRPGDPCYQCGSTDTGVEDDVAVCRGCGASDSDD